MVVAVEGADFMAEEWTKSGMMPWCGVEWKGKEGSCGTGEWES